MQILSVCVGLPKIVEYNGEPVATAIFKEPVAGKVRVGEFNLEGDRQADLRVHGGYSKAVYVYPSEHYEFWREELPEMDLPFGMFGENLTSEGLMENEVFIGDRIQIGTAEFHRHRTAPTVFQTRNPVRTQRHYQTFRQKRTQRFLSRHRKNRRTRGRR